VLGNQIQILFVNHHAACSANRVSASGDRQL